MAAPARARGRTVAAVALLSVALGAWQLWQQPRCPADPPPFATVYCGRELTALRYAVSHWDELRAYESRPPGVQWSLDTDEVQTVLQLHTNSTSTEYIARFVAEAAGRVAALPPDAPPLRVLLLGLGGGSAARLLHVTAGCADADAACRLQLVGVDASGDALAITRTFVLPEARGRVRYVRARAEDFMARSDAVGFDVIFADVYVGTRSPPGTRSAAFAARLHEALRPGGLYLLNWFDVPEERDNFDPHLAMLRGLYGTAASVWEEVLESGTGHANRLVFAQHA